MKTIVDEAELVGHKLQLILEDTSPRILYDGHVEEHLEGLVQRLPELSDQRHLALFAKLANFLFSGLRFELIEDTIAYRTRYEQLYREDPRVAAYGLFDLSPMAAPTVAGDQLIFYVEEISTGLPFQVSVPFPYRAQPYAYKQLSYNRS